MFACLCICALYACSACRGLKRAVEPLESEFQVVMSCHVVFGSQPRPSVKSSKCSWLAEQSSLQPLPTLLF